jgi:Transcription initiation factor TFIID subunit A
LIAQKIAEQEEIKKVYSEKVVEKREKYVLYMEHLKVTKNNQLKKYEALQINLEKIFNMQKELSIFLKMTNKNYKNGLEFLDLLKDVDGNAGID